MIGIFDSGLGGLTAYKALHALLPHEDFVYFGDTGRLPYGSRSREILTRYARQDVNFLISKGVDAILAACGTISSVVLDNIKNEYNIPITGVVDASAEEALGATKNGIVGVIGTGATISPKRPGHFRGLPAVCAAGGKRIHKPKLHRHKARRGGLS